MELQIKKSMISLRKIAAITDQCKIDSTNGEIEPHIDGLFNNTIRTVKGLVISHRIEMIRVLNAKYSECKELIKCIVESEHFLMYLPMIRNVLINSKKGLAKLQSNIHYSEDIKIKANLDHLAEDEVPYLIKLIESYVRKNSDKFPVDALSNNSKHEDSIFDTLNLPNHEEKINDIVYQTSMPIPIPSTSPKSLIFPLSFTPDKSISPTVIEEDE